MIDAYGFSYTCDTICSNPTRSVNVNLFGACHLLKHITEHLSELKLFSLEVFILSEFVHFGNQWENVAIVCYKLLAFNYLFCSEILKSWVLNLFFLC